MRQPGAKTHVADWRVNDGRAAVGEPLAIIFIEPDGMSRGEMRSEHAELVEMSRQRLAVLAQSEYRLRLGLRQMCLQRQVIIPGQIAAADEKLVTAMKRNG